MRRVVTSPSRECKSPRKNSKLIEDTNGSRLDVFYDTEGNLIEVRELFADGTTGRSLDYEYESVLGVPRISPHHGPARLGLEILYEYDA